MITQAQKVVLLVQPGLIMTRRVNLLALLVTLELIHLEDLPLVQSVVPVNIPWPVNLY